MELTEFARILRLKWYEHNRQADAIDDGILHRIANACNKDIDFCVETLSTNTFDKPIRLLTYIKEHYKTDMYFDTTTNMHYKVYVDDDGKRYINKPAEHFANDAVFEKGFILNYDYRLDANLDKSTFLINLKKQLEYLFETGQIDEKLFEAGQAGLAILDGMGIVQNPDTADDADIPF